MHQKRGDIEAGVARPVSTPRVSRNLLLLYTLFIVYGCTIPFRFTTDRAFIADKWAHISWNPLRTSTGRRFPIPDAVQNVLFFAPFGVLATCAFAGRVRGAPARIAAAGAAAAALSVSVEAIQLFTVDRVVSATDVTTNTIGALVGAAAAVVLQPLGTRSLRRAAKTGLVDAWAFYPFVVALAVVLVAAWQPFNVTLDVSTFLDKIRSLRHDLWQFSSVTDGGVAFVHGALLGAAACAWLVALGVDGAVGVTMLAGLALSVALELSQLFIESRSPGLWDAIVRAAGIMVGAACWRVRRRLPATAWVVIALVAIEVAAAAQMLSPFAIAPLRQPFEWLPFMAYSRMPAFETLGHIIEVTMIFLPAAFVVGLVRPRGLTPGRTPVQIKDTERTRWSEMDQGSDPGSDPSARTVALGAVLCLCMAAPLEYAQGWIVARYSDVTDLAVAAASGAFGAWMATQGARRFRRAASAFTRW